MNIAFLHPANFGSQSVSFRRPATRWTRSVAVAIAFAGLGFAANTRSLAAEQQEAREPDRAETAEKDDGFMRIRRADDGKVLALETALVRYVSDDTESRAVVDLVGAIHVADRDYYKGLNQRFRDYDVVLYELVAPEEGAVPAPGERSGSPVTAMQVGMKNLLDLHFQLDCVDYMQTNFVHADLTVQEFAESMSARGESVVQMFFRVLGQAIAMQSPDPTRSSDFRLFAALFSQDRSQVLKRIMAEEFERSLSLPSPLEGPNGSTIITVRNQRAMDVLAEQLQLGKKRIAIFYGAAHLPDMENQLRKRFALGKKSTQWLTAWDIP